jgi:hypothetical protein
VESATGTHKISRQRYSNTIPESLPIIAYTEQTAYEARICAELEGSGKRIGALIVAVTVLEHGTKLASFNKQHFAWVGSRTELIRGNALG